MTCYSLPIRPRPGKPWPDSVYPSNLPPLLQPTICIRPIEPPTKSRSCCTTGSTGISRAACSQPVQSRQTTFERSSFTSGSATPTLHVLIGDSLDTLWRRPVENYCELRPSVDSSFHPCMYPNTAGAYCLRKKSGYYASVVYTKAVRRQTARWSRREPRSMGMKNPTWYVCSCGSWLRHKQTEFFFFLKRALCAKKCAFQADRRKFTDGKIPSINFPWWEAVLQ